MKKYDLGALSKNQVIYHRGERRVRRVLRRFQSLFRFSGAFAFSVCSAVNFEEIAISLKNSTVPDLGMLAVTLVLPAYNEAEKLEDTVNKTIDALKNITDSFEIILAEDGSTDGTDKIAEALAKKYRFVEHFHSDCRLGRGGSLKRAFEKSTGNVLAYIDVDLSTDMSHLKELIDAVSVEDFDIATGSRMLPESNVKRPIKRSIASACFNALIRLLLKSRLYDHQCGFKSFKRESLFKLIDDIEDEGWFWDTELLVLAQKRRYRVKEFPVRWRQCASTRVNLISDVTGMGRQIIRMWLQRRRNDEP